jgi:hypothetical protein
VILKYLKERKKERMEQLELLRQIAKSIKALEDTIDNNPRYGKSIKTIRATTH